MTLYVDPDELPTLMPDVRDWAWPFGDEGRTPTDEIRGSVG